MFLPQLDSTANVRNDNTPSRRPITGVKSRAASLTSKPAGYRCITPGTGHDVTGETWCVSSLGVDLQNQLISLATKGTIGCNLILSQQLPSETVSGIQNDAIVKPDNTARSCRIFLSYINLGTRLRALRPKSSRLSQHRTTNTHDSTVSFVPVRHRLQPNNTVQHLPTTERRNTCATWRPVVAWRRLAATDRTIRPVLGAPARTFSIQVKCSPTAIKRAWRETTTGKVKQSTLPTVVSYNEAGVEQPNTEK